MRMIGWLMVSLLGSGNAGNLKALIDASHTENHQIQAQTLKLKAKGYEVEAKERAFWPTLDAGVMHKRVDPNTLVSPGETTTGFVTIGVELYDGGRKRALLRAEALAYESLSYEASAFEKSVTLDIIQRFYLLKKYQAELEALGEKSKELQAQMRRLKRFLSAGLASRDELDRLQAVYDNNLYTIASVELEKESEAKHLALKSGMAVDTASTDTFREPAQVTWEPSEQVKILESSMKVMEENAYAAGAAYRPHLKVENTYSRSDYQDTVTMAGLGDGLLLNHQNSLTLSLGMRLFDAGKTAKEREALQYRRLALESEKVYAGEEQKLYYALAKERLETVKAQIQSAQSGLRASQSSYKAAKEKYEQGLIGQVVYLETLTERSRAASRLKAALYDYEIAKSLVYYYAGKDPKEYLQ